MAMLVLKKLDIREVVSDVFFNEAEVWLQIFKLPKLYEWICWYANCLSYGRFCQI